MQRVQALLVDLGVVHEVELNQPGGRRSLITVAGAGPRNAGRTGSFTAFTFDDDGSLLAMGSYVD